MPRPSCSTPPGVEDQVFGVVERAAVQVVDQGPDERFDGFRLAHPFAVELQLQGLAFRGGGGEGVAVLGSARVRERLVHLFDVGDQLGFLGLDVEGKAQGGEGTGVDHGICPALASPVRTWQSDA